MNRISSLNIDKIKKSLARFQEDTADHSMKIISDDGDVTRCIRFCNGSSIFSYTLTTWPGYLCISGDMGTAVFCRTHDMFNFFGDGDQINPGYWGQKLEAASDYKEFSADSLRESLRDWLKEVITDDYGFEVSTKELTRMVDRSLIDANSREEAMDILKGTEINPTYYLSNCLKVEDAGISLDDFIDVSNGCFGDFESFEDYSTRYLWLCWAVAKGSRQYRSQSKNFITPRDEVQND